MSIKFIVITLVTFLAMDIVSHYAHKYVFHGFLWSLHKSHHVPRKGIFERNDLFSTFFASLAIILMACGVKDWGNSVSFALGSGLTLYGFAYFFVHDIYTHRRFVRFESRMPWLNRIRQAHRIHHQHVDKTGHSPFGFIWFRLYKKIKLDFKMFA